jgi:hypothetical protein
MTHPLARQSENSLSHGDAPRDMPRESGRLVPRGRRVLAWCVDEGVQDQFVGTSLDTVTMALLTHTGQGATEAKLESHRRGTLPCRAGPHSRAALSVVDWRRNDAARCCARADRVRSGAPVPTAPERVGVATACLPGLRLSGDMP